MSLCVGLMKRFIKKDVMSSANSTAKLLKIDPMDTKSHAAYSRVDLGFAALEELSKLKKSLSVVSERQIMELKLQCRDFLAKMCSKLLDKCPLKYSLVRNLSCLDPRELATSKDMCLEKMKKVLHALVNANRVRGGASACDDVLLQFDEFIGVTVASNNSTFASFDPNETNARVDELLHKFMANNQHYRSVWRVVSDLLLLSHGQASVERGFSVNRQIEVENLHEESVVAQRLVCDHINNAGGIHKVYVSKQLLISAASARQKYMAHLDERKRAKVTEEVARKRKDVLEEIDELKRKKKRLESDIV